MLPSSFFRVIFRRNVQNFTSKYNLIIRVESKQVNFFVPKSVECPLYFLIYQKLLKYQEIGFYECISMLRAIFFLKQRHKIQKLASKMKDRDAF